MTDIPLQEPHPSTSARPSLAAWLAMADIYGPVGQSPVFAAAFARALGDLWRDGTSKTLSAYLAAG